ncbi:MAG: YidC/Oxa1 family membrane protein insertase [Patescibacteria group bacterium]|nr:YidC/Oxa1 family membrane protein insertase [Patescibacteria group bacterium]
MEIIINAFNLLLYQPLFNALILLYQYLPGQDFGIAVIVLTCLIRLILYPLMAQSIKTHKVLTEIQPKIKEIQQKYKTDRERQAREMIKLYKKEKINPFSSFLPLLIHLPILTILIALFLVFMTFKDGLDSAKLTILYPFVSPPNLQEEPTLLGLINLTQPSLILAVLAGICQFFQNKMSTPHQKIGGGQVPKKQDQIAQFSNLMQKQMLYFFPVFTVFILTRLPAAIGLYLIITFLFSIGQQYIIFKKPSKDSPLFPEKAGPTEQAVYAQSK